MASYHFSLRKDRKPDKTKVKCVEHVEYIERKGKYANEDKAPDNFIAFAKARNILDGEPLLLYSSDYGEIINTPDGLKITGDSSEATIAVALAVASEVYKDEPVILKGRKAFKEKALSAIIDFGLEIKLDKESQRKLARKMEEYENERREFRSHGGKIIRGTAARKHDAVVHRGGRRTLSSPVSLKPPGMRELSQRHVDHNKPGHAPVLLQDYISDLVEHRRAELASSVRRDHRDGRRRLVRETAGRILKNIEESEDQVHAFSHVEYINREAAFESKGGCIHTENHLPKWAKGDAKKFFAAADRYEGKKNVRYLEFQCALPNELNIEQNLELIHNFIEKEIPDHYYTFAIHDKVGAMSDGSHNLHVHLMFSPRLIDEAEKEKERAASRYFLYPKRNAKTLAEKRKGGAHVDRRLHSIDFLREARKDFAEITNSILEKYGKPDRVDHRSIKAMREEALMNGDEFMAALLNRVPERNLGPLGSMKTESPAYKSLMEYRQRKKEYQDKLFETEILRKGIHEIEMKKESDELRNLADELMRRNEFDEIGKGDDEDDFLVELKEDFLDALKQVKANERAVLWTEDAVTEGRIAFLNDDDEKEKYQSYLALEEELDHWKEFYAGIDPDESTPEYLALLAPVQRKIDDLKNRLEETKPSIQEMDERLMQPEVKDRMQKFVHRILEEDKYTRTDLEKSLKRLRTSVLALDQAMSSDEELINKQESYTLRELYTIMRKRFFAAKNEYEKARKEEQETAKAYISPERATKMAENIFVRGAYKDYRAELRTFKKEEEKYFASLVKYNEAKKDLQGKELPKELEDRWTELEGQRGKLEVWKAALDKTEMELRKRCEAPGAPEKIQEIAMGILRKNTAQARLYQTAKKRSQVAYKKYSEAKAVFNGIKAAIALDKSPGKTHYAMARTGSGGGTGGLAAIRMPEISAQFAGQDRPTVIAAAINGNAMAKNIVSMRNDSTCKDWKLMSVFEQEEEQEKAFKKLL